LLEIRKRNFGNQSVFDFLARDIFHDLMVIKSRRLLLFYWKMIGKITD